MQELDLRAAPAGTLIRVLSRGDYLFVRDDPVEADGVSWHPVAVGGGSGWVAGGTQADPFIFPFSGPISLSWLGVVESPPVLLGVAEDFRTEATVTIGLAYFDTALFDPGMLGALNVAWGSGNVANIGVDVMGGRTTAVGTTVVAGLCDGNGMMGGQGQLGLRAGGREIWFNDELLGFSHTVATASLPNIGQALLISYYGARGRTCIDVEARGDLKSTTVVRRVITTDCMTVASVSPTDVVLIDDSGQVDAQHRFTVTAADEIDPAVVSGATLGLRVYAADGWEGPSLAISPAPEACSLY